MVIVPMAPANRARQPARTATRRSSGGVEPDVKRLCQISRLRRGYKSRLQAIRRLGRSSVMFSAQTINGDDD